MADYKEYDVEFKGDRIRISPHESAGCGTYFIVAIMIIIAVFAIRGKLYNPEASGDYKIKKGKTEYVLAESGKQLTCWDQWDTRKEIGDSRYDYVQFWTETSSTSKINGNFKRLTGRINLPKASNPRTGSKTTVFEYWDEGPLPVGASKETLPLFASNEARAEVEQRMISQIKRELSAAARDYNLFTLSIYGDGKWLYTSPIMIEQNSPVSFNIDVTGVQQLDFKWSCAYVIYGDTYGLANITCSLMGHTD